MILEERGSHFELLKNKWKNYREFPYYKLSPDQEGWHGETQKQMQSMRQGVQ